jgi:hypothetical protein
MCGLRAMYAAAIVSHPLLVCGPCVQPPLFAILCFTLSGVTSAEAVCSNAQDLLCPFVQALAPRDWAFRLLNVYESQLLISDGDALTGYIPTQIGMLSYSLEVLDASPSSLSGTLPTQLGLLTHLAAILIDGASRLSGTIPTQLGQLRQLAALALNSTRVSGSIRECQM